jgi:hypothetical protein
MKKILCAIAVIVTVFACKREAPAGNKKVVATAVSLDKNEMTIEEEAQEKLSATFSPSNATGQPLVWESSDQSVAQVADGIVTGILPGYADIIVKSGELADTCRVTVVDKVIDWDSMGHVGSAHVVNLNRVGTVGGTEYTYECWTENSSHSFVYYDNGTFSASWNNIKCFDAYMGFDYGTSGPGVDPATKKYVLDYKYSRSGSASAGGIGVYVRSAGLIYESCIFDDWWSNGLATTLGTKFGEYSLDGETYTVYLNLRKGDRGTVVLLYALRKTARQSGRIHISEHMKKWKEMFDGKDVTLNGASVQLQFGNLYRVSTLSDACSNSGSDSGSIDYTYFNLRQ